MNKLILYTMIGLMTLSLASNVVQQSVIKDYAQDVTVYEESITDYEHAISTNENTINTLTSNYDACVVTNNECVHDHNRLFMDLDICNTRLETQCWSD